MDFINAADVQRVTGGLPAEIPTGHDRRLALFLWVIDSCRNGGLAYQIEDALLWNNFPFPWMNEAARDLATFNGRCLQLGWPTALAGLKHKAAHPGDWLYQGGENNGQKSMGVATWLCPAAANTSRTKAPCHAVQRLSGFLVDVRKSKT
ncbi:hypothetical protein D1823_02340 [Ruegeria sp. AD91A]|uniref:hypothetical protein n=1 Tax=Ruegeria sp. AD91A TaxID=2293862 RepID=UPI000E4BCE83|nr:hypothetical protein [Ruegeria sp. AD91A]AXT25537.1 hypothetical protein D1823_02340 [Ruegeria sp. AD91A]